MASASPRICTRRARRNSTGASRCPSSWSTSRIARTTSACRYESHWYGYLPRHGYLVLRVDCRGTGASEGITGDEYTLREQRDGHDAIEWCAAQPWCDGHVNMIGISYGGFTSLQVASHTPPHLTSIVPIDFTDDRYTDDCHYRGGHARMLLDPGFYGAFMVAFNALPPAPARSLANWAEIWEEHLAGDEPYVLEWLRHQTDGPYWRNGSVADVVDRIRCPVFMIGGWRDGYPNPQLRLFESTERPAPDADRALGPRGAQRGAAGAAHRLPRRGRALARPLVPRA